MESKQTTRRFIGILTLVCVFAAFSNANADPLVVALSDDSARSMLTIEQVERALEELEQSTDIAVGAKLQAAENFHATIKNLESARDSDARMRSLVAETESIGARIEQLKRGRAEQKDKKPTIDSTLGLMELEQLLAATEIQLSGFKKLRQDTEMELQLRSPRRKEIRTRMVAIHDKFLDASTQLKVLSSAEASLQTQSLTARLLTRRQTLESERLALEAELAKFDAEEVTDLLRVRMEYATGNATFTEKFVALLQQQINIARKGAADASVRSARREAISVDSSLKDYADQNQELAERAQAVAELLSETESKLKASTEVYEKLERQFAQTRKKVDTVGLTSSVGALLRKQLMNLPDVASRRVSAEVRQTLINDTQFQLLEYEEAHQELSEIDGKVQQIVAVAQSDSSKDRKELESAARDLLIRKQEHFADLVRNTSRYFDALVELDTVDRQIIKAQVEYETYIVQRVLWIRSGPALTTGVRTESSDTWMLAPSKWKEAIGLIANDVKRCLALYLGFFGLIGILIHDGPMMRRELAMLGEKAEKATCRRIGPTTRGLWLTIVVSLTYPLICLFIGWRLSECAGESEFTAAIGQGLKVVGILWASFEAIRQMCRRKGIGESHFNWPTCATSVFRREVKFCTFAVLPIAFVTATLASSDGIYERSDISRVAFILGMCVLSFAFFRLLRPAGVFREYCAANPSGFIARVKYSLPIGGVAMPMSLAALASAGYFFTAQTLFWRLFATCMTIAFLVAVRSVLYRMLLLRRRYLSMEQARERATTAKLAGDGVGESQSIGGIATENKQADISTHSMQSRNLISTGMTVATLVGLWMIWIQVLPALSMVGNYSLWGESDSTEIAESAEQPIYPMATATGSKVSVAASSEAAVEESTPRSVTLSDLAFAILIAVVTVVLFRNGPGLLEMSILQQLPFDASVRYAITTLVSYLIVMAGTIAACSTIGLQWSQIQWLATALTFGLAFGLQEMFANFVSGLIILIERPIRVGDVVTVDDVTGVVSRIRIRATSITNWDRKEYVVPNKEFITGRLLNWTLSDKVNRVVVEVGLAHGSDTEQARGLLIQAANNHPLVLKDPPAMAGFEGFGDHALKLTLRAFLPTLDNRLQVIHELHTAIDQAFRRENIVIAFPQRDLHIRTMASETALGLPFRNVKANVADELRDVA